LREIFSKITPVNNEPILANFLIQANCFAPPPPLADARGRLAEKFSFNDFNLARPQKN